MHIGVNSFLKFVLWKKNVRPLIYIHTYLVFLLFELNLKPTVPLWAAMQRIRSFILLVPSVWSIDKHQQGPKCHVSSKVICISQVLKISATLLKHYTFEGFFHIFDRQNQFLYIVIWRTLPKTFVCQSVSENFL